MPPRAAGPPARRPSLRSCLALALPAVLAPAGGCGPGRAPAPRAAPFHVSPQTVFSGLRARGIDEASGVVRSGDHLLLVGDDEHGFVFDLPLTRDDTLGSRGTRRLPLDPDHLERIPFGHRDAAFDLEGIGVLADGRTVALSEGRGSLFDESGVVAEYAHALAEFGGRGLEGVAVRPLPGDYSRVAVLWEGGYPEAQAIPPPLRERNEGRALRPCVLVHDLAAGERSKFVAESPANPVVELRVPEPAGAEPAVQRFRAPDLVWHSTESSGAVEWSFIVLLSSASGAAPAPGSPEACAISEDGAPRRYCHKWLQRFSTKGEPIGPPFDLDPVLPEELRTANWEGLGWFDRGRSLALVYDESVEKRRVDPQEIVIIPLPAGW